MMEDDIPCSSSGEEIQIMLTDDDSSKKILAKLSKDLGVDFSIAGGKIERYRDQQLGSLVLIFEPADIERVCSYLDSKGIVWHHYTCLLYTSFPTQLPGYL